MMRRRSERQMHWDAVQNRRPPAPYILRVRGRPSMPTPLHVPMLRRADVQGSDPRVLVPELTAIAPVHPAPQIVTDLPVSYEERSPLPYDRIRIRSAVGSETDVSFDVTTLQLEVVRGGAHNPRPTMRSA